MKNSIKGLKPSPNSKYFQGYFTGAKKYFGPQPIIYRSSLEFIFMQKIEMNPAVASWSSENIVIPYQMKEKVNGKFVERTKNYHIDFTVNMSNGKKFIVEIKPCALIPLNESQIHRNPVMYKNACKWRSAIAWCKNNGYTFLVIDEKKLKGQIF